MRKLHLFLGLGALGLFMFAGCGDDDSGGSTGSGGSAGTGGSDGSGASGGLSSGGSSSGGKGGTSSGGTSSGGTSSGGTSSGGSGGTNQGGDTGMGCGSGPECAPNQRCVAGTCKLVDGETCSDNAECINTCINHECGPRSDLTGPCDYEPPGGSGGAGGEGGEGGGGPLEAPSGGAGAGGEAGAPGERGNGDDSDCLDGLACDSGSCKRLIGTDCSKSEQCLSGLCHKDKCTSQTPGTCVATECMPPNENYVCAPTTVTENDCGFNYLPNASCLLDLKGTTCYAVCQCNLVP